MGFSGFNHWLLLQLEEILDYILCGGVKLLEVFETGVGGWFQPWEALSLPPPSSDSWPTEVPKFPPVQTRTRDTKRQGEGKEEGMFRTLPDQKKGLLLHFGKSVLRKKQNADIWLWVRRAALRGNLVCCKHPCWLFRRRPCCVPGRRNDWGCLLPLSLNSLMLPAQQSSTGKNEDVLP